MVSPDNGLMNVLVTGGAGYIGSHTCLELLNSGHRVTVVDDLSNSSEEALNRVRELTGKELDFHQVNLLDKPALKQVFINTRFDAVIHFAGLKAVGESMEIPLKYYHNNVGGTLVLCEVMAEYGVKNIVFSSSATVYGRPEKLPVDETAPLSATNPYGRCKLIIEDILRDLHVADPSLNVALLRYFNPIGAHKSGRIGEDPDDTPNNLMPFVSQVAVGKLPELAIFGNDYNTIDGTGVRDYIHVVDLAVGHLKALEKLAESPGVVTYNLGTGQGHSVLEIVNTLAKISGRKIPYRFTDRRPGDIDILYADPSLAAKELDWRAERDLETMCQDTWRWQSQNPDGY